MTSNRFIDLLSDVAELGPTRNITGMQILMLLEQEPDIKLVDIAKRLRISPAAITVLNDRLEEHGYVTLGYYKKDRRRRLVQLTPEGRRVVGCAWLYLEKALSGTAELRA